MKAISFLEYYRKAESENFFRFDCYGYFNKVSQPFTTLKEVEKLFNIVSVNLDSIRQLGEVKIKPKTIDEFIVLCNNLNIELTWKQ